MIDERSSGTFRGSGILILMGNPFVWRLLLFELGEEVENIWPLVLAWIFENLYQLMKLLDWPAAGFPPLLFFVDLLLFPRNDDNIHQQEILRSDFVDFSSSSKTHLFTISYNYNNNKHHTTVIIIVTAFDFYLHQFLLLRYLLFLSRLPPRRSFFLFFLFFHSLNNTLNNEFRSKKARELDDVWWSISLLCAISSFVVGLRSPKQTTWTNTLLLWLLCCYFVVTQIQLLNSHVHQKCSFAEFSL